MLFTVAERILLLNVVSPAEGDILFLRSIRTFRESLGFTDEEADAISLKQNGSKISWDVNKATDKEITFGPAVATHISNSIKAANGLREEHIDFYLRFVQGD